MSTTAIIIEILIVGIMSSIWITLLILTIFGYDWIQPLFTSLKGWELLTSFYFISFFYAIGIFVDRIADVFSVIIKPQGLLLKFEWIKTKSEEAHSDKRMYIMCIEKKANEFLEHIRSRIRIVRAALINIPLITVSLLYFLKYKTSYNSWENYLYVILVGVIILTSFFWC